jgi:hypothetical protein
MTLYDPSIWGPHFWFFLDTIAMSYPKHPNSITKKIYFDLIQNFHLFIPVKEHSENFNKLLSIYPISPYLDDKESLIRWVHFIHNKINSQLSIPNITYNDFYINYYNNYKEKTIKSNINKRLCRQIMYFILLSTLFLTILYLSKY